MTAARITDLGATEIEKLPVEKLAWIVLSDFEASKGWHRGNWMNGVSRKLGEGSYLVALAEAWSWLEARSLVVMSPTHSSEGARVVGRIGRRALESGSFDEVIAAESLSLNLHPSLGDKVTPIFRLGDYETGAFKAMKEVEVRVREMADLPYDLIGVALMRKAFDPKTGTLRDPSLEKGEQEARSHLFAGAIGSFKNPTSHRPVTYTDPVEASEVIFLADLLMRVLDSIQAKADED